MAHPNVGHFVWHELRAGDPKAAIEFYTDVVGWKTQPFGESYTMWVGSQGPLGGTMALPEGAVEMGTPPQWIGSVQVENVDASAALAQKLGGTVRHGPEDIPTVGRFAVITDPQGAAIDLFQPSGSMGLHDDQKDGEFCWNELMTSNHGSAFRFYSELFGWKKLEEMSMGEMGSYLVYGIGEKRLGGMMTLAKEAGMPPVWIYYVQTRDLEAAIGRATNKGAKVINGPMDVPGGRIAQLIDSQGALFALHQVAKA